VEAIYRRAVRNAIESPDDARAEDAIRVRLLRAEAENGTWLIDRGDCLALAHRLERAAQGIAVPKTFASKTYMRRGRLKVGSSLYQLVDQSSLVSTTFTLVSPRWTILAECLPAIDPRDILHGVRSDLNRCGIDLSNGAVFMALDGEFERSRTLYQLHVNGLAFGSAISTLEKLRTLDKYKRVLERSSFKLPIYRPVVVRRAPLTNLASTLPYLLKPYWPSSWLASTGDKPRSRTDQRIPEPYHSQWLLWMDRWRVTDITLLMGMYAGADGLTFTNARAAL
jgi:hypothetical protein